MPLRETVVADVLVGMDALRIHPTRTLLSVLGIMIGCAALVTTMAVSDGMMHFAREQVQRETSVQVVSLSPRTAVYRDGQWSPVRDHPVFTLEDARALREQLASAQAVTMMLSGRSTARYRGTQQRTSVVLGNASMLEFGTLEIGAGRFFSEMEVNARLPVAVLNYALARELAPMRDPYAMVGEEIYVRDRARRVIGVLTATELEDTENPSFALYAPIAAAPALLDPPASGRFAPVIQLLAPSVEGVDELREAAGDWLSRRYARWQERVNVVVGREQLRQVERAFLIMKLFVGALVSISLLVGGVGIMNVLLASVAERTREIGIRKSVGARRGNIHTQFLTESVSIALAGAVAGLTIGFGAAWGIAALFRLAVHVPISPVLSPASVLIAVLSSSLVGLVFGTYPARRAAELSPVAAIAHE
jgi:putative ABC transport system permease protein